MKSTLILAALSAITLATPAPRNDVVLDMGALGPATKDNERNDVLDGKPCKYITLIFARGTTEPGNIGILVGPPVMTQLEHIYPGQVNTQGVKYPASIGGYLAKGDKNGGMLMAKLANQVHQKCPQTHIILSGYSQGGYLTHRAAENIDSGTASMTAALIFGDPLFKKPVGKIPSSRVLIVCHKGDDICGEGKVIKSAHLTYSEDTGTAADFIKKIWGKLPASLAPPPPVPVGAGKS